MKRIVCLLCVFTASLLVVGGSCAEEVKPSVKTGPPAVKSLLPAPKLPKPQPPSSAGGALSEQPMSMSLAPSAPVVPSPNVDLSSVTGTVVLRSVKIVSQIIALSTKVDGSLLSAVRFNMERAASEGFLTQGVSPLASKTEDNVVVPATAATVFFTLSVNIAQGTPVAKDPKGSVRYAYRLQARMWNGVVPDEKMSGLKDPVSIEEFNGSALTTGLNAEVMSHARTMARVVSANYGKSKKKTRAN